MQPFNIEEAMWFFIYLLEHYAEYKGMKTGEVLQLWDAHNITNEIYDGYFQYHQERIENAYEDIESLLTKGRHAVY